jgi:hypothetical protein
MKNEEMCESSPLRRKRNIYSVLYGRGFLQNGDSRSMGSRCILFMESLIERGFDVRTVVAIGRELAVLFHIYRREARDYH